MQSVRWARGARTARSVASARTQPLATRRPVQLFSDRCLRVLKSVAKTLRGSLQITYCILERENASTTSESLSKVSVSTQPFL